VVETDIHYPTDATLLWDTVRTVTRLVGKLHEELPGGVPGFTNRTSSARRRMQELERMSASQRHPQPAPQYRELLHITGPVLENARPVVQNTAKIKGMEVIRRAAIDQLCGQITSYATWAGRSSTRLAGACSTESKFLLTRKCTRSLKTTRS
jgi:transposase, IS5 family